MGKHGSPSLSDAAYRSLRAMHRQAIRAAMLLRATENLLRCYNLPKGTPMSEVMGEEIKR